MEYTCGDKPGKGMYRCRTCGEFIRIENDKEELPPCPKCGDCTWDKLG